MITIFLLFTQSKHMSALLQSRRWAVIGAGPCGIGVVGRLVDLGHHVTWIDPHFDVGRMGPFYRNVPANTLNCDLLVATRMCESFKFEQTQQRRRERGETVMMDLPLQQCFSLGYLVDFLEDATTELKQHVNVVHGKLVSLQKESLSSPTWTYEVAPTGSAMSTTSPLLTGEIDGVINITGCKPVALSNLPVVTGTQSPITALIQVRSQQRSVTFHSLDCTVDPHHIQTLLAHNADFSKKHWIVVGSSHSGMLVVKNLAESGAQNITVIHRSPVRFMTFKENGCKKYQGTGLKGPVGDWVKAQLSVEDTDKRLFRLQQYDESKSWEEQLLCIGADHVIGATGFIRDDIAPNHNGNDDFCHPFRVCLGGDKETSMELQVKDYDKWSGEIVFKPIQQAQVDTSNNDEEVTTTTGWKLGVYGGGIAYPQNHRDEEGEIEPWVGFKRSIEQTDLMIQADDLYRRDHVISR